MPRVTVITPTFNHASFIADCLRSTTAQTFGDWEQFVIDDGSTDGTGDVVRAFRDPRIHYVRQERLGLCGLPQTYNRALALGTGSLVAVLEGDDWWPADKLETLVPAFRDEGVVLAYGRQVCVGRSPLHPPSLPDPRRPLPRDVLFNMPVGRASVTMMRKDVLVFTGPSSIVLRRASLDRIGGFRGCAGFPATDYPTLLRIGLLGRFHFEDRPMSYWRLHPGQATQVLQATREKHLALMRRAWIVVREFHAACGARLGLSAAAWSDIEAGWERDLWGGCPIQEGRRLLAEGRLHQARGRFRRAARTMGRFARLIAIAGLGASMVGASLEGCYRMLGRPYYRRLTTGGFSKTRQ